MASAQEVPSTLISPEPLKRTPDTVTPRTAFQRPPAAAPGTIIPDTPIVPPIAPGNRELYLPNGSRVTLPGSTKQLIRFAPRYDKINAIIKQPDADTKQFTFVGGLIVNVTYEKPPAKPGDAPSIEEMEFAADSGVVVVRGSGNDDVLGNGIANEADPSGKKKVETEMYLSGNVVIRAKSELKTASGPMKNTTNTLRADQVFYRVNENKCIALDADLELSFEGYRDTVHMNGKEVWRLGQNEWRALNAEVFASKLPSDPALILMSQEFRYTRREVVRRNIFGIPYRDFKTGETEVGAEQIISGRNVVSEYSGVPFFYTPYLETDATDPLGPLTSLGFGNDRIFGFQFYSTWDAYKLLAIRPPSGHRWRLNLDYLGSRGPAIGSNYQYANTRGGLFGGVMPAPKDDDYALERFTLDGPNHGETRMYLMNDGGSDQLGGIRGPTSISPGVRGRADWFHDQDLLSGPNRWMRFQGQFAYQSDRDFREQYYKQEFDTGRNVETYAYLNGAVENLGGSVLIQPNVLRPWVTEAQALPRLDGYLIGQTLFNDTLTYSARGSLGYYQFHPAKDDPLPIVPTDMQKVNLGRFGVTQKLSAPFDLGPVRLMPYGVVDTTYYTEDLSGSSRGRLYGGGGIRASLPFSRYYDAESDLFNLKGLYHKGDIQINYFNARTNTRSSLLPQIDRLNDDSIQQAYNYIRPVQSIYVSGPAGLALANSPQFDPQVLAVRRLLENHVDTLDNVQVIQVEDHERLQTKRGFPGSEHTIDWFSLDTSISFFPEKDRDNFGRTIGLAEYSSLWNVGDRTALSSSGFVDPLDLRSRYFSIGTSYTRPDGTMFQLSYRQIDPVNSRAVTLAAGYQLSHRYSMVLSSTYDFGIQSAVANSVTLNRVGTDVTVSVGITYNAIVNNFGLQMTVIPNIANILGNTFAGRMIGNQMMGLR
ncbi:MAG: hypothetical protein U0798_06760 [Gemmataceae bacterium]